MIDAPKIGLIHHRDNRMNVLEILTKELFYSALIRQRPGTFSSQVFDIFRGKRRQEQRVDKRTFESFLNICVTLARHIGTGARAWMGLSFYIFWTR